ncbi:MAG: adenylyltransferase/cytidyltransferase family protein [Chitinispirillales bacterium]|jgi:glycerol-3-phosphate cytidylyltransferase|nr:adenylyltransferase/cytidyltransferase family protein [Chitinispirillales bacterium]
MLASQTDKIWNTGYVSGSFDMFHIGHLNLIRKAKGRCGRLIVGVLADQAIANYKHKWPVIPLVQRVKIVEAIKYVDEVDVTTKELLNKITAWKKYRFDAMFSGDDHINDGWAHEENELKVLGAELVFFPYTKEISTTALHEATLPPKADNADAARKIEGFTYIFPFDKVKKDEKVVVYGTGKVGEQYARQLDALNFCEITAFADTYAESGAMFCGKRVFTPEELAENINCFDRIVIASPKYHDQILNRLRALGIHPERIA